MREEALNPRNKAIMFAYLGKLVLWTLVSFLLLTLSLGGLIFLTKVNLFDPKSEFFPLVMIVQSLALFLLPMLLYRNGRRTILLSFKRASKKLGTIKSLHLLLLLGICLGGSAALGVVSEFLIELLPKSWGISTEDATAKIVEGLLRHHSPLYLLEIFSICLLPAFVEELFFRATLQRYMLVGFARPMVAIIVTAFIFSLAHLSVVGLLPRLWLGLVFGYLYYDSRNIFLSMGLHFLNNLTALVLLITNIN